MTAFLSANLAPIMFGSMLLFLLIGYPVAFALAACGLGFGLIGIELGLLSPNLFQAIPDRIWSIMSNDTHAYPEDSFTNMQKLAKSLNFSFPYLYDPTQHVARDYGAACTPDFFGFNRDLELQYRGRLDSNAIKPATPDTRQELVDAMRLIGETGRGPAKQIPSMGCSIKWRDGYAT